MPLKTHPKYVLPNVLCEYGIDNYDLFYSLVEVDSIFFIVTTETSFLRIEKQFVCQALEGSIEKLMEEKLEVTRIHFIYTCFDYFVNYDMKLSEVEAINLHIENNDEVEKKSLVILLQNGNAFYDGKFLNEYPEISNGKCLYKNNKMTLLGIEYYCGIL